MKPRLLLLLFILLTSQIVLAQQPAKKTEPESKEPVTTSASAATKKEAAAEERRQRLSRVYSLSETILAFREPPIRALNLARLAVLLWHEDEPFSRRLFQRALDLSAPQLNVSDDEARRLSTRRARIVSLIAQRDSAWAQRLNRDATTSRDNFRVANDLLKDDPGKAVEFADRSLSAGVDPGMYSLLLELRAKDEAAANALFLRTIGQLASDPHFEPMVLLNLGVYIFTAPGLDPGFVMSVTKVGNILVPNLTADRPGIPPSLIRSYLEVAGSLLARPLQKPADREAAYVAARVFAAKAQRFAPELADRFVGAMSALAGNIPPDYMQDSTYKYLARIERPLSEQLEEIDKLPFELQRDARYMDLISNFYRKNDLRRAREMLLKISDLNLKDRLSRLISFAEIRELIEKGSDLEKAEIAVNKLPMGIERSILWLAIAKANEKSGDQAHTQEALSAAMVSARKVEDARRPFLMLNAASQLARLSVELGKAALAEALKEFNKQKADDFAKVDWREQVDVAGAWRHFSVEISTIDYGYEYNLRPFAQADPEGTLSSASALSDETQRGEALMAIAAVWLKK